LTETGYVEGRNVAIEYRWAEGQFDKMPMLAADLVRRRVSVIFANGPPSVLAAKAQTATIPIVFFVGEDPVKEGLVASLNRPGGNVTGVTNFQNQLFGKELGLLRDIAPKGAAFALLVNPNNPNAEPDTKDARAAADALGLELRVLTARIEGDLEPAFTAMVQQRLGGLLVGVDNFGTTRERFAALAARHSVPAIYQNREDAVAGGLMSYGASRVDAWRQAGVYVGRILKGEKPADMPVQQAIKFEFVINLKTAKALRIDFPPGVLAIADEVIE
jgi:putative ABC transport system substrate-binding protein